ncbi:hypothetical protein Ae168Ps1_6215c [Pseudonocardia sp. Ae168_Ps1]|nr:MULTISPECIES: hypothetical protein [unclassified Pseudonocardia]OLL70468.1 hypothetical protein Ae168Ps1_6215c [Pseudonocardia sp. Ae168_Ps1]OLL71588.1 hypothetical protein Ae263Ps1_6076c [Pseudonocardia sp. Ae263_Ps1]
MPGILPYFLKLGHSDTRELSETPQRPLELVPSDLLVAGYRPFALAARLGQTFIDCAPTVPFHTAQSQHQRVGLPTLSVPQPPGQLDQRTAIVAHGRLPGSLARAKTSLAAPLVLSMAGQRPLLQLRHGSGWVHHLGRVCGSTGSIPGPLSRLDVLCRCEHRLSELVDLAKPRLQVVRQSGAQPLLDHPEVADLIRAERPVALSRKSFRELRGLVPAPGGASRLMYAGPIMSTVRRPGALVDGIGHRPDPMLRQGGCSARASMMPCSRAAPMCRGVLWAAAG